MTNPLSLTGNTIYLGLGIIAPHEGIRWIKALTSILSFCLGSFFFARFHRAFSPKKRWVLISSYLLQTLLIALAALIVTVGDAVNYIQKLEAENPEAAEAIKAKLDDSASE